MNSHYTQAEELLNLAATHRSLSLARSSGYERDHALAAQCAAGDTAFTVAVVQ